MEEKAERVLSNDEGAGSPTATPNLPANAGGHPIQESDSTESTSTIPAGVIELADGTRGLPNPTPAETPAAEPAGPPKGYEGTPSELWPDKDGNPPVITPALLSKLR